MRTIKFTTILLLPTTIINFKSSLIASTTQVILRNSALPTISATNSMYTTTMSLRIRKRIAKKTGLTTLTLTGKLELADYS